jgi:hypothetical protein
VVEVSTVWAQGFAVDVLFMCDIQTGESLNGVQGDVQYIVSERKPYFMM